jgi:hypothetical protein
MCLFQCRLGASLRAWRLILLKGSLLMVVVYQSPNAESKLRDAEIDLVGPRSFPQPQVGDELGVVKSQEFLNSLQLGDNAVFDQQGSCGQSFPMHLCEWMTNGREEPINCSSSRFFASLAVVL